VTQKRRNQKGLSADGDGRDDQQMHRAECHAQQDRRRGQQQRLQDEQLDGRQNLPCSDNSESGQQEQRTGQRIQGE
jgi:hypothetical protein